MASESTAASLPARTQHLPDHSPSCSPARAPGAERSGYAPLKSRGHPWVSWGGIIHTRQGEITNCGRQQTARTKGCSGIDKSGWWRRGGSWRLTVVQEELGNGQQGPGIGGIPTDPAVQDFQEGDSTAHVGGVLFADDVHDCHCLNETLQESRE